MTCAVVSAAVAEYWVYSSEPERTKTGFAEVPAERDNGAVATNLSDSIALVGLRAPLEAVPVDVSGAGGRLYWLGAAPFYHPS